MFCTNCGNKLEDGAKFCDKCGCAIDNGDLDNSITSIVKYEKESSTASFKDIITEIFGEFLSIIKSPLNTVKELKNKNNVSYIGIAVLAFIITVINSILINSAMFRGTTGNYIESMIHRALSITTTSIIITSLILNIIIVAVSIGLLFLLVNKIFKNNEFSVSDSLKTIVTGYAYSKVIIFIAALLAFINMQCTTVLSLVAVVSNIIIVFHALNENNYESGSKNLYAILIMYIIIGIIYWIFVDIQINSIVSNISDLFNSRNIYNSMFY